MIDFLVLLIYIGRVMTILHRIWFNIFSFCLGAIVVSLWLLVFSQSGDLTASVFDAFKETPSEYDFLVSRTLDWFTIDSKHYFPERDVQSFRIHFDYNDTLDTSQWSMSSTYAYSLSYNDWKGMIIVTADGKDIALDTNLLNFVSPVLNERDQIIVRSMTWYSDTLTEELVISSLSKDHRNKE